MEKRYSKDIPKTELLDLYSSVAWNTYTSSPAALTLAIQNSTYVVAAWDKEKLIGLARCLSDDCAIMYFQDILVNPTHQRTGVGRTLAEDCLKRFQHCRQRVLITDNSL